MSILPFLGFLVVIPVLLAGEPSDVKLYATNNDELYKNVDRIAEALPPETAASFKEAIFNLTMQKAVEVFQKDGDQAKEPNFSKFFNGRTVREIIKMGETAKCGQ